MTKLCNSTVSQADRNYYLDHLNDEGTAQYGASYASGMALLNEKLPVSETNPPQGFPGEDFNNFATLVYLTKDNKPKFDQQREVDGEILHIDAGTGPNIDNFIAALSVADKLTAIELSPANLRKLESYKTDLPSYWEDWLDVARIMYDLGSPQKFLELDKNIRIEGLNTGEGQWLKPDAEGKVNLYDSLRKWSVLSAENKALIRKKIYTETGVSENPENPYVAIQQEGLQNVLARKLTTRQGDYFNPLGDDRVPSIADLEGKAHLVTQKFATESNTDDASQVVHGDYNIGLFCRKDDPETGFRAFRVMAQMAGTSAYKGFIPADQLAENPSLVNREFPVTREGMELWHKKIMDVKDNYAVLTGELSEDRQMVRPDMTYKGAVFTVGHPNYTKPDGTEYEDSLEVYREVHPELVRLGEVLHTSKGDKGVIPHVVQRADKDLRIIDEPQLPHTAFNWDTLDDEFWERYAKRHYQNPEKTDLEHLLSVITDIKSGALQEDSTFVSVRTASAPQYALAALAGGMENIIVSHQGKPGIDWLNKNLLSDNPDPEAAQRVQMWWEISKLLSTFKNKDEFSHYCEKSGFHVALNSWAHLTATEKKMWFNRRLEAAEKNGVTDHFITVDSGNNIVMDDARTRVQAMADNDKLQVRKFSPMDVPADLKGKADVVECSYITDSTSLIPSERLDCFREVCSLAKKETGRVNFAETAYTNWDVYEPGQSLPGLELPLSYLSLTAKICAENMRDNNDELHLREASNVSSDHFRRRVGAGRNMGEPLDSRFDYLEYASLHPQEDLSSRTGVQMLAALHQEIVNETKRYLFEHPDSLNLDSGLFKHDLSKLEEALGMQLEAGTGFIASGGMGAREALSQRLDKVKEHLASHSDDLTYMNRVADVALSEFLEAAHDNLVSRERVSQPMQTYAVTSAGKVGYVGARR